LRFLYSGPTPGHFSNRRGTIHFDSIGPFTLLGEAASPKTPQKRHWAKASSRLSYFRADYDTYAYRCKAKPDTLIFEVDQSATQLRKLERLARAGIPIPQTLTFVSVDFEHEALADQLIEAGCDPALPSLFVWLGVTYYLAEDSVAATLRYVGSLPAAEIVFDYINPLPEDLSPEAKAIVESMSRRIADLGEPIRTRLDTGALHADMKTFGLYVVEDLAPSDIFNRFLGKIFPGINPDRGWRFLHAATGQSELSAALNLDAGSRS